MCIGYININKINLICHTNMQIFNKYEYINILVYMLYRYI